MEFRILGPLEFAVGGRAVPLAGPKQRAVLALLVLNANEVVPRDRLIDDLWGDEPPAEAAATLRVYVARLRKILSVGNGAAPALEALRNGYVLRVSPELIDLNRFDALVAAGETALAAGRAAEAAERLAEALAVWRGPALADLADEPGVRREAGRLEELRLRALEKRIDADLAAGRHAELVAELEGLVPAEPYRERFAAQLMVALYRCGRQPDALRVYGRLRTALHDDFALEPTQALRNLERQILAQDPVLDLPTPVRDAKDGPAARERRLFGRRTLAAVAAALVVLLAGGLLAFEREPAVPSARPVALRGNSVVAIDQRTRAVLGETRIGGRPSGLAVGFGSVWVGNLDDRTLLRIDARTRRIVDTIGLGTAPTTMAVGGGSVWIVSHAANAVLELDPVLNDVVATVDLPRVPSFVGQLKIAFARGYVWVKSQPSGLLMRIDPQTHVSAVVVRDVATVASSGRALWAILGSDDYRLRRLDPPGEAIRLERLGATYAQFGNWLVAGYGVVWTASPDGTLWRIDADTSRITASVPVRRRIGGIALAPRAAWIVTTDGHVVRVDSNEARVTNTIALGLYPPQLVGAIAAAEGTIWVAAVER